MNHEMDEQASYSVHPIGIVKKIDDKRDKIEIFSRYQAALEHLEDGFTHVVLLWWAHQNDNPTSRSVLKGKPPGHPAPVMGVFATRSPHRPNPIMLTVVRLLEVTSTGIVVKKFEAFEGTPLLDIKPYLPNSDCFINAKVPAYFEKISQPRTD